MRFYLEAYVDRSYRVTYQHKSQKVHEPNHFLEDHPGTNRAAGKDQASNLHGGPSIYYAALWLDFKGYQHMDPGDQFNMVWNPALEARSRHIVERYGDNKDLR